MNHSAPSGPVAMPLGRLSTVGIGNSVKVSASACSAILTAANNKTIIAEEQASISIMHAIPPGKLLRDGLREVPHRSKEAATTTDRDRSRPERADEGAERRD